MAERAALLARVSTRGQEEKETPIKGQLTNCHAHAAKNGYSVVAEFSETGSGYAWVFERKTIADLWQLVTSRKIDVIVVDDLDRLAREPDYQAYLRIDAAKYDVRIEAFTGQHDDTFEGQLVAYVEKLYGKYESVKRKH
jgi:DNA invertase Pin-like site-specific DNA recombinase